MGSIIRSLTECIPMKARRFPIGPKTSCGVRARMHQGRRWTNKLRTPTTLELEYLRVDDKTIDEMILSSLLRKVRLGPVCESFEAKFHAACMTAMISGPRYGSTSDSRVRRTQPNLARRQYTSPFALFPNGRRKCAHIRRKAPIDSA